MERRAFSRVEEKHTPRLNILFRILTRIHLSTIRRTGPVPSNCHCKEKHTARLGHSLDR